MNSRTLGRSGPTVSAVGLGALGMSDLYGAADEAESIATIHAAIDAGVSLQQIAQALLDARPRDDVIAGIRGPQLAPDDAG